MYQVHIWEIHPYLYTGQETSILFQRESSTEELLKLVFQRSHNMYHLQRFIAEEKQNNYVIHIYIWHYQFGANTDYSYIAAISDRFT